MRGLISAGDFMIERRIVFIFGSTEECRDRAALEIRKHRRSGRYVSVLNPGRRWEMLEAEDAAMVYDDTGIMALTGEDDVESSY